MDPDFWLFAAVGFAAQLVDGALGMAYGVISTSVLLSFGVSPANASASVHAAKVFTGLASGASHIFYRNIDWRLLGLLSAGGVLGGIFGAYVLTSVPGEAVKPYVVGWLFLMGLVILYRAWRQARPKVFSWRSPFPLGLIGGFFDAIGGGGGGAGGARFPAGGRAHRRLDDQGPAPADADLDRRLPGGRPGDLARRRPPLAPLEARPYTGTERVSRSVMSIRRGLACLLLATAAAF